MNIQGGGLSFEISGSNDKLLSVLNESKKTIQNFSTAAISGGKGIDRAFENAAAAIEKGFADIDRIVDTNKASLAKLQEEYKRLSSEAAKAFQRSAGCGLPTLHGSRKKHTIGNNPTRKTD